MAKIFSDITKTVGNTPLVKLNHITEGLQATVIVTLESFNPLSSVKDRIGVAMIEDAEKRGVLKKNTTIIEPTSGNTGVALAFVAAAIAGSNTWETGWQATLLSIGGFLVTPMFIYQPMLLMQGAQAGELVVVAVRCTLGVVVISCGCEGWLLKRTSVWGRIVLFLCGLGLGLPLGATQLIALLVLALMVAQQSRFWERFRLGRAVRRGQ